MSAFSYKNNILHVDNVPVPEMAEAAGTPFYCYSATALENNFTGFRRAVEGKGIRALICFAVKSNANPAVLKTFADAGAGADIVSGGELELALETGVPAEKIVFSGVGKTPEELTAAVQAGIFQINVESAEELQMLNAIAEASGKCAAIGLRVNPDVDARTHAKISTGKKENKFGISWGEARRLYREALDMKGVSPVGIDVHIGSQLTVLEPFEEAFKKTVEMVETLRNDGVPVCRIDIGGGLGVAYRPEDEPPSVEEYAALVQKYFKALDCLIIFEPGRRLTGEAGILTAKTVRIKKTETKNFLITDAGMNDLVRPAMYDAYHGVIPVIKKDVGETLYDVVGPVCESSDVFAKDRLMQTTEAQDLIAFETAGAYGSSMSSNYNMHPLAAEVLVRGDTFRIVRRRQTVRDITALCSYAPWQKG